MKATILTVQKPKTPPLESDLAKLAALIRERQSSLIMLLEEKRQKIWNRPQWLLMESEYQEKDSSLSRQIRHTILNWVLFEDQTSYQQNDAKCIRNFWLKIKIVLKMSLERVKILGLLNESLFQRYETIIQEVNNGFDKTLGILHYRNVEDMIKNRNKLIHEILCQKMTLSAPSLDRNHSEYQIKSLKRVIETPLRSTKLLSLAKNKQISSEWKAFKRPFSQQNRRKILTPSRELAKPKKIKKLNVAFEKFEDKLYDIMEMKIDAPMDRKKPLETNIQNLHNDLLDKNANNHKVITNFLLSHSGKMIRRIPKKLVKMKQRVKEKIDSPAGATQSRKEHEGIRARGVSVGKLKKMINKIGQKCILRAQNRFPRKKKLL